MFQRQLPPGGFGGPYHHGGDGLGVAELVVHSILWAAVIVLAFLLFRQYLRRPPGSGMWGRPRHHPVIDELDTRYARGEISREEWVQRRTDLTAVYPGHPLPPPPAVVPVAPAWTPPPGGGVAATPAPPAPATPAPPARPQGRQKPPPPASPPAIG